MPYDDRDEDLDISVGRDRGREEDIPNHLAAAILATLFCCVPFGIVSIVAACRVETHIARGDLEAARQASDQARTWCLVAFVLGLIVNPMISFVILTGMGG